VLLDRGAPDKLGKSWSWQVPQGSCLQLVVLLCLVPCHKGGQEDPVFSGTQGALRLQLKR